MDGWMDEYMEGTMTASSGYTFDARNVKPTERIEELQQAIQESTRQLEEIRQKRQRAEEDIVACAKESERRLDLIMGNGEIVDMLQQVGHLLERERNLSNQLQEETSSNRRQCDNSQERTKYISNKEKLLTAKIMEVKLTLAEVRNRNAAAQALIQAPSKSKRNQRKPK